MQFQFDRDILFFEASSALSALRRTENPRPPWRILKSSCEKTIFRFFPRIKEELGEKIMGFCEYYLIFFPLNKKNRFLWADLSVTGPARLFPISVPPESQYIAGQGFDLAPGQSQRISYKDFQLHFLGICLQPGGSVEFYEAI